MSNPQKPNILLFFTDMQRADTIHALGNPVIRTPNLDRLVNEGAAFTSCYSPSPVCVPARCCLHYGLYARKTGLYRNGRMMDDNGRSMPALLAEQGYVTHAVGKCHFTPERNALRGFHSRDTQEECCSNTKIDDYVTWLKENGHDYYEPHGARGEMYYIPQVSALPVEAHPSQWVGDRSIDFIRRESERPWLLFSSFIHPHPPAAPPKPWHKLYRSPFMPLPKVPREHEALYTWINRHQNRYKYRDNGFDLNLVRTFKAYYYATISFVDYQIGRILDTLEELGQLDDTIILFTSDHGEYLGDYQCFGKRSMHDASAKVPMLVRYPEKLKAGLRCDQPTSLIDILPTVAKLAGVDVNEDEFDGTDMIALADGQGERKVVYSQYERKGKAIYMVVSREWKYFYSAADEREYLFDRINDPDETRNMAGLAFVAQQKDDMKQNLLRYLKSNGAEEAFVEENGKLDWRKYPRFDDSYLDDPDNNLLIQDYGYYSTDLPGYTD